MLALCQMLETCNLTHSSPHNLKRFLLFLPFLQVKKWRLREIMIAQLIEWQLGCEPALAYLQHPPLSYHHLWAIPHIILTPAQNISSPHLCQECPSPLSKPWSPLTISSWSFFSPAASLYLGLFQTTSFAFAVKFLANTGLMLTDARWSPGQVLGLSFLICSHVRLEKSIVLLSSPLPWLSPALPGIPTKPDGERLESQHQPLPLTPTSWPSV